MFLSSVRKGFKKLIRAIRKLLIEDDALGKMPKKPLLINATVLVNTLQWSWKTDPEKLKAFKEWLKAEIGHDITGATEEILWKKYVEEGFKKGAGRAFDDTMKSSKTSITTDVAQGYYNGQRDQFLRDAFGQPVAVEKVQLLASRSFNDMEGVTSTMASAMNRTLADGLVQGKSPLVIAKDLERSVEKLGASRAETIARTEIIRAHAEGQLFAMEQMGVSQVGVMVEWSTAGDDLVCPQCAELEGQIMPIAEAKGKLPLHPRCRCSWIPAV